MATQEEKISVIKDLLGKYVAERIKAMADSAALRGVDVEGEWADFLQKWLEDYHGEDKVPHYVVRELVKHIGAVTKPYNIPYVREITENDWADDEPELNITVSANEHNLLGSIEVNVYARRGGSYEIVQCGVSVDDDKNISIRTATRFAGKIEVFSSVGETPELQHRQPVYTVNGVGPDDFGNLSFEALANEILEAHNNDPDAHRVLIEDVLGWE
jgi:hypothetical protein